MSDFNFAEMAQVQKKGRSGGNFKPAMNLPVRIKEVHLAEEKQMTRGKDWIEAYLLAPAWGMQVNDEVKIRLIDRGVPQDPEKAPLEFFDVTLGKKVKGRYRVGEYAAIIAEDARPTTDGFIECRWIRVAEYAYSETPTAKDVKDLLHVGMVSTGFLRDATGNRFARQTRSSYLIHEAELITGSGDEAIENFRKMAVHAMRLRPEEGGTHPSLMFRVVNNNGIGTDQEIDAIKGVQIRARWNKETETWQDAETAVNEFLSSEDNAIFVNWIRHADAIANGGGTIEIWPVFEWDAGKMALDNEIKAKSAGKPHTAEDFTAPSVRMDGTPEHFDNGGRRRQYGLVTEGSHKLVMLDGRTDWTADQTDTLERFPSKLFAVEELPTHNLPEHTVQHLVKLAAKRVEDKKAERNLKKDGPAAEKQEAQPQDFGGEDQSMEQAPDPTAGHGSQFRVR